ncbi:cell division protein FtsA [bacterium]|nr:cell division protein FtsA [bacterium]
MKEEIIAGLDIGTSEIRLVISQKVGKGNSISPQVIGAVSVPTVGFSKGVVNSIEDITSSISACVEKAERLVGLPINNVWLSLNDPKIRCERSKGVVAVGKSDGEINDSDIQRAIEAAGSVAVPANYEVIHTMPVKYAVDNQEDIKDPIGMSGIRLEVETLIILALSSQLKNLTKAVHRTGLEVDDVVISSLALGEALLTKKQKDLGAAVVNIGATTTSVAVYEEGTLMHTAILPIGSEHITSDIAIGLRCPINLAERIKVNFGEALADFVDKQEEISLEKLIEEEEVNDHIPPVSKKYLSEIIEARVEEIFNMVDLELKKIDRSGMLPAGIFLTGGGSELNNISEAAKKYLRLPAALGKNRNLDTVIDKVNNLNYSTALGLIAWADYYEPQTKSVNITKNLGDVFGKVKSWVKRITP